MGWWKVLRTGQSTGTLRARPLAGRVKLVNIDAWLQHRSHMCGQLKKWKRLPMARSGSSLATWGFMWMISCSWPRTTSSRRPCRPWRRGSHWLRRNGSRGRKLSHFVAMKSQRPTRAMRWDKRNTSATSWTSTTSNKQQGSRAQRLKKDQKSLLRTSKGQSCEQPSSCAGS